MSIFYIKKIIQLPVRGFTMSVVISDDVLQNIKMSESEIKQELALLLFQKQKFTLAQAARFAGITRLQFQELLAYHKIPVHYDIDDLNDDLKTNERLNNRK